MTDTLARTPTAAIDGDGSDARLDAHIPDGPAPRQVGHASRRLEARQPEQQAQVQDHRRRHRARRRVGGATLAELGYQVEAFTFHDSPRRAHSIAAQGGINAAKNYRGDGDSVHRLFYDTIKGGDFRSREAQRLPAGRGVGEHHRPDGRPGRAVRPRVRRPARQPQLRRRPGQPHVLRPRPDRPAAAARCLPADGPPGRSRRRSSCGTASSSSTSWSSTARCAGIVTRDLLTGEVRSHAGHAVVLATGGYGNVFFLSTNAMACNVTAAWRAHRRGRLVRQPVLHADPPDVHPAVRRVPVEAHADVGVAAQRRPGVGAAVDADEARRPTSDPRGRARLLPRAAVPELRQPRPAGHRLARRQARRRPRPRRRAVEERRLPRLRRRHRPPRRAHGQRALREPVRDVRAHHRRGPVPRCRCASTRRRTTRWAGSGSTTS